MENESVWLEEIEWALQSRQNTENARAMTAYMQNHFSFFGIKAPEREQIMREIIKSLPGLTRKETIRLARKLWHKPEREYQLIAVELLKRQKKYFILEDIEGLEYFISTKSWWDTVDIIATHLLGAYFRNFPKQIKWVTNNWLASGNIWLQRSCMLFQLKYKEETDVELLTSMIEQLANSPEFFIQKAIGWALREYSKTDPSFVKQYIDQQPLAPLSKREALKIIRKKS